MPSQTIWSLCLLLASNPRLLPRGSKQMRAGAKPASYE